MGGPDGPAEHTPQHNLLENLGSATATLQLRPGTAPHRAVNVFIHEAMARAPDSGWLGWAMGWLFTLLLRCSLPLTVDMVIQRGLYSFAVELPWLAAWMVRLVAKLAPGTSTEWRVEGRRLMIGPWLPQLFLTEASETVFSIRMDDLGMPEAKSDMDPLDRALARARRAEVDLESMEDQFATLRWSIDFESEPDAILFDEHFDSGLAKISADLDMEHASERTRTGSRLAGELALHVPADWGTHLFGLADREAERAGETNHTADRQLRAD